MLCLLDPIRGRDGEQSGKTEAKKKTDEYSAMSKRSGSGGRTKTRRQENTQTQEKSPGASLLDTVLEWR